MTDLITFMLPHYKREGKSQLVIAIGCTGGQHRSVTLTEYLGKHLKPEYSVHVSHRDVEKRKPKIVIMGGGTGLSVLLIKAISC